MSARAVAPCGRDLSTMAAARKTWLDTVLVEKQPSHDIHWSEKRQRKLWLYEKATSKMLSKVVDIVCFLHGQFRLGGAGLHDNEGPSYSCESPKYLIFQSVTCVLQSVTWVLQSVTWLFQSVTWVLYCSLSHEMSSSSVTWVVQSFTLLFLSWITHVKEWNTTLAFWWFTWAFWSVVTVFCLGSPTSWSWPCLLW